MRRRYRGLVITGLLFGLFLLGMAGAIATTGWSEVVSAFRNLGPDRIAILLGLSLAHYILRATRWHLLARAAGLPTSLAQNFRHYFGCCAMTATPGRLGELVRLRWIGRETGWPFHRAASFVLADRAVELAGIALLIALAVGLSNLGTDAAWPLIIVSLALAWVFSRPGVLIWGVTLAWRIVGRWPRLFARLRRMTAGLAPFTRPAVLVPTLAVSLAGWFIEGFACYALFGWLGVELDLWTAAAIFLTAVLSGALSGLPGGLGSTEAAMVALLLLQGVPAEMALVATAVIRATTLWFAVLIGMGVFPLAEARARS